MAPLPSVSDLTVEEYVFPATVTPPESEKTLFLAGAGVRGLNIQGTFVKFTAIGVYVEAAAVDALRPKWASKSADDLETSEEFFKDIINGDFEKFTRITLIKPLRGEEYTSKVVENCVAIWKSVGIYTDAEAQAVEKLKEVFKEQVFPPGSSIAMKHSTAGSLTIAFSKDTSVPEKGVAVIENKALTLSFLESVIGKHGVSPEAKRSVAERISGLLKCAEA
ncbi:Chalcone--flavonone isomerase 2 [Nymphaea thermarum]|nr:Chalcone--flavonone isomerase 2 [Nymphaea thermarum]